MRRNAAVLFHPDCNRRFRNFTGSIPRRSRGVADCTAGEDFHLALKTSLI